MQAAAARAPGARRPAGSQALDQAEAGLKRAAEAAERARREEEARAQPSERERRPRRRGPRARRRRGPAPRPVPAAASVAAGRRRAARRAVRIHASIDMRSDSNFFTGFSMDISEGGVFIATVEPVPRGTPVELDFTLPGGRPLKVSGVVRWVARGATPAPRS